MKTKEVDFLKKFKKLSAINEATIKTVNDSDDVLPHQYLGLAEEEGNKDQQDPTATAPPAGDPAATAAVPATPESGATPSASGSTPSTPAVSSGSDQTQDMSMSPEDQFDQGQMNSPMGDDENGIVDSTKEREEDIQNELLKLQVSAMRKMSDKISELENAITDMNMAMVKLENEVDTVREPSPIEKLENRWQDSYPFKYTLSDIWDGNVFQGRKDLFDDSSVTKGDAAIVKTADGYEAEYDKMPKLNDFDLKKSFEVY
jgi:hypothetical protein